MNGNDVHQILINIDAFRRDRNLTRRQMAQLLDIPYNTVKKWFIMGQSRKNPSPAYIEKMQKFLESQESRERYLRELWRKVLRWWETQHKYRTIRELSDEIGWDVNSLGNYFHDKEMPPKLVVEKISDIIGIYTPSTGFALKQSKNNAIKIEHLSLLLEEELRWFRDGSKEVRDVFRQELDPDDLGYISSLLTMLGDEGKFKRWVSLTTNRFNFFKRKGRQQ